MYLGKIGKTRLCNRALMQLAGCCSQVIFKNGALILALTMEMGPRTTGAWEIPSWIILST